MKVIIHTHPVLGFRESKAVPPRPRSGQLQIYVRKEIKRVDTETDGRVMKLKAALPVFTRVV